MKTILIIGKNGQVGSALEKALAGSCHLVALDRKALDVENLDAIAPIIRSVKPDVIVNSAAYTAVDAAENEAEKAMKINALAPAVLAKEAKRQGALFIHYSTDYVFDGKSKTPYKETDPTAPLNIYGKTKLLGEEHVKDNGGKYLIFRTSWVYGMRGKNFLLTMLRLGKEQETLRIVDDQIGAPTWSRDIAAATARAIDQADGFCPFPSGIYHLQGASQTSWFGFATEIFAIAKTLDPSLKIPRLVPVSSEEYRLAAARPLYSVFSQEKLRETFNIQMPCWKESLLQCLSSQSFL